MQPVRVKTRRKAPTAKERRDYPKLVWGNVYAKVCAFSGLPLRWVTPPPPPLPRWLDWKCLHHLWFNEHMMLSHERFFFPASWKVLPLNLDCVSSASSHEAPSKAISSLPSIPMIINHAIITLTVVHLQIRKGGREIFLSGGRITYDPFMSRWEPLKIIIHHSRGSSNNWKAPSVINLMGFAYFFLPHKDQAGEITQEEKKCFLKTLRSPQSSH